MKRKHRKSLLWRRFGWVILVIIKFGELLLWISPGIINVLRNYIKHSKECFIRTLQSWFKKKTRLVPPFSTHFSVFGYLMKHSSLCVIYRFFFFFGLAYFSCDFQVIFRALNPQIAVKNPYSEKVQNLLKLTNIRINFTKLHTLGDLVLNPTKPDIKLKYYYAVYDLVIRGSSSCYGHAERCLPLPGEASIPGMVSIMP